MNVRLEIVWDGDVQGLEQKRLSLDAFGPALRELLAAIRRIASDIELRASGPGRGRLAREAENLDVQISAIQANSPVTVFAEIVPLSQPARPLIADLPDMALEAFMTDVEREVSGQPAHYRVRKYLASLPAGLTSQTYVHRAADGGIRRKVEVGSMALPVAMRAPHLIEFEGVVVGVGFEPGRLEVKLRASSGELVTLSATPDQVESAVGMPLSTVRALAVAEPSRTRLLKFGGAAPVSDEARTAVVFESWPTLLARLAR